MNAALVWISHPQSKLGMVCAAPEAKCALTDATTECRALHSGIFDWKEETVAAKTLEELSFVDLITVFNAFGASSLAFLCKTHNGFSTS